MTVARFLVHLCLSFPRRAITGLNLSGSFLLFFCNAVIPGSHPGRWTEPHGEPEKGSGQFRVTHESGAEAEGGLEVCSLDSWSSTHLSHTALLEVSVLGLVWSRSQATGGRDRIRTRRVYTGPLS